MVSTEYFAVNEEQMSTDLAQRLADISATVFEKEPSIFTHHQPAEWTRNDAACVRAYEKELVSQARGRDGVAIVARHTSDDPSTLLQDSSNVTRDDASGWYDEVKPNDKIVMVMALAPSVHADGTRAPGYTEAQNERWSIERSLGGQPHSWIRTISSDKDLLSVYESAPYILTFATAHDYQGQGIGTGGMRFLHGFIEATTNPRADGTFAVALDAEGDKLRDFYRESGYKVASAAVVTYPSSGRSVNTYRMIRQWMPDTESVSKDTASG